MSRHRSPAPPLTLTLSPPSGERGLKTSPSPLRGEGWGEGRHWRTALFSAILIAAPPLHACSVCWGNPDDPLVKGANAGIWVLLSVVAAVQIGFVALFWSFRQRAREQQRFRASLRVVHPFDPVEPSMQRSSMSGGGEQS